MVPNIMSPVAGQNLISAARKADSSSADDGRRVVDLRSDTVTHPTPSMRRAMTDAAVGDDVYQEDPTVNELERMAAELFGMEAALFVPSGTMGNLICVLVHCGRERSAEAIIGDKSHLHMYEQGGISQLGGVYPQIVPNLPDGTFDLAELESKVRGRDVHLPITSVICIENTHNGCGGKVLPLDFIDAIVSLAKKHEIPVHCDGARIYNAAIALGQPVARLLQGVASVSMCLSKGLCAPMGALIGGTKDFIWRARRLRKALGGGMRQAGIVAAAGIVALVEQPPKLAIDHERAQYLARRIDELNSPFFRCDPKNVLTNIIMVELLITERMSAPEFSKRLNTVVSDDERQALQGQSVYVKAFAKGTRMMRKVVNQDITQDDVELVVQKLAYVAQELEWADT